MSHTVVSSCFGEINVLLCTLESLKTQIRSLKSPGILFLRWSMNPENYAEPFFVTADMLE